MRDEADGADIGPSLLQVKKKGFQASTGFQSFHLGSHIDVYVWQSVLPCIGL